MSSGPAVAALCARAKKGMALGLDRLRAALAVLGDPQAGLAVAHVAGSNGKGSTCAMLEAVARAAGLRTGLYTSPHLCRIAERIRLDGEPVGDELLERALARVLQAGQELTFFELMTAAAFVIFREADVDLAIVEVGLGGRLDATNVIDAPLATAVTSIALEHCAVLGDTLAAIAREKGGIVKPGAALVVGPLDAEAEDALVETARARSVGRILRVVRADSPGPRGADDLEVARLPSGEVMVSPPASLGGRPVRAVLGLVGAHQADNAAVACGLAWQLAQRWPAIENAIEPGLRAARWPGRFEAIARGDVTVLLDCAHNPHGARALAASVLSSPWGSHPERTLLVFGALADKPFEEMLRLLSPLAARRFYAPPKGRGPADLDALTRIAPGEACPDAAAALSLALAAAEAGDVVLVTGSSYLVGEVRGSLLEIECDPVIAL